MQPLVYFWIAEYNDKTSLTQFDPKTGIENLFGSINQSKLTKFYLVPFTKPFAELVNVVSTPVESKDINSYLVELKEGDKLEYKRTVLVCLSNTVQYGVIYKLGKNGMIWSINSNGEIQEGDVW